MDYPFPNFSAPTDSKSQIENIWKYGSIFAPPTPPASSPAISHGTSDLPYLGQLASGVNNINLGQQEQALPGFTSNTAALTQEIHRLLNPGDPLANADVTMHGAESAAARGTVGSPLSGETTGRMREADIERRAALGNQLLSGQVSRTPAPFDVSRMILTPAQFQQLDLEQQRLYLDWYKAMNRGGGGNSGGGYGGGSRGGGGGSAGPASSGRSPAMLDLPYGGGFMSSSSRLPGGEPSPDAGYDEWAAYYANLPADPTADVPAYEGFDYTSPPPDLGELYA